MLDDLVAVIETLQQRIREHGATLRENETRTRMALIDPLLVALGWDVSDPGVVTPEYGIGDDLVDYALLGSDGQPVALVEAKKLGEPLAVHEKQLIGYCQKADTGYGVLTDGRNWRLYDVSKANAKAIDTIPIVGGAPAHQVIIRLLPLWQRNLTSKPPEVPDTLPLGVPNPLPLNFPSPGWVALSSFNPPRGSNPPTAVRFPGESVREVKNWRDLVVEMVKWLSSNGSLTPDNLPVPLNPKSKRYIVSARAAHGTGSPFGNTIRIDGTRLSIDGDLVVGIRALGMAMYLLEHCGVSPYNVQLRVDD